MTANSKLATGTKLKRFWDLEYECFMHIIGVKRRELTRVFVALEHELRGSSMRIPELDTPIFGSTENPSAIRSKGDAENKVLS